MRGKYVSDDLQTHIYILYTPPRFGVPSLRAACTTQETEQAFFLFYLFSFLSFLFLSSPLYGVGGGDYTHNIQEMSISPVY